MPSRRSAFLWSLTLQFLAVGLIAALLITRDRFTHNTASLIKVGMTPSEVEGILGQPSALAGCVFTPITKLREDHELKVDAIGITPTFYPLGPGLPGYILHSRQEEFPTYFGQLTGQRYDFWLAKDVSMVVLYDNQSRVAHVFALPTTIKPGNLWIRMQWYLSQLLGK